MMVKKYLLVLISGLLSSQAQAQVTDTVVGGRLREVHIIGQHSSHFTVGTRQTTIDSAYIQLSNAGSLAEVLQTRTPLYLKNYGNGMLASIAFRGTSASQTAVIWHGFTINLPTLGQTDFSQVPVAATTTIQLQHGSGGANYGSGAIGGAVLLSSATAWQPGLKLRAQQDIGSFGQAFSQLAGSFATKKIAVDAAVYTNRARNNFKFKNITQFGAPHQRQENAEINQLGATGNLQVKLSPRSTLAVRSWYAQSDNEVQPSMVTANTHARLAHKNARFMSEWQHRTHRGHTTSLRAAFFDDYLHYRDDNTNSETHINTYQAQAERSFLLKDNLTIDAGGEVQHFTGQADGYRQSVQETRAAAFLLLRYDPVPRLHLNLNVRQAWVQRFDPPLAPTAGFSFRLLQQPAYTLNWKGNLARGYRVPTLNDRYWPTGNTALKPENSWSYETGFAHTYSKGNFTAETELTAYTMQVRNWIQWIPAAGTGAWSPQNLKRVKAQGLELSTKATHIGANWKLAGGLNYAFTASRQAETYGGVDEPIGKQLIYVPLHTAAVSTDFTYRTWLFTANYQLTGQRFTTTENERWLPAYGLVHIYGGKTIHLGKSSFQVIGRINNLTNRTYQNYEYYAMPPRHYTLSIRYHFRNI